MPITCISCHKTFPDYSELACHIMASKKGHRKGKKWASRYLLKTSQLDRNKPGGRTKLTEEDKQNKLTCVRPISGQERLVPTYCPRCKTKRQERLPVEYVESNQAWRMKGSFVVICTGCK